MIDLFVLARVTVYRESLVASLNRRPDLRVRAAASGYSALEVDPTAYAPAVVLVDTENLAATADLSTAFAPAGISVILLGVPEEETEIIACAEAGASGYLTRASTLTDLVTTIVSVSRDELDCPPRVAGALIRRVGTLAAERRAAGMAGRLTPRERQILRFVADGLSNRAIAELLTITVATVKNHVHNIFEKLEVSTRAEASAWARKW